MAKEENIQKESAFTKQGLKGAAFMLEMYIDKDGKETYVVKTPNGLPVRLVNSPSEVSDFLIEVALEFKSDDERQK